MINASGIAAHKHFMPVFSSLKEGIVQDCKLSDVGYGLVLMNANPNLSTVGDFQVNVLKEYFKLKN